jgi:hypothetical protein
MSEEAIAPVAPAPAAAPSAPAAAPAEGAQPAAQNTAETAPAAKPGEEKKPETPDQAEKRGTSRFERKIGRLHREAAEARAERDLFKRQLEELRPKQSDDPSAPKLENFKDIEEYANAKAKHEADKVLREHNEKQRSETQKQARERLVKGWEERVDAGADKYDDYAEVVGDLQPTTPWAMAIMEADNGPDIAYHLGKNLKEAQRIASLPPVSQIREIGRLEAKLAAEPPKPKTASKAPPPITPLSGTSPADSATPSETDDIGTWIKKRQKQVHGARR